MQLEDENVRGEEEKAAQNRVYMTIKAKNDDLEVEKASLEHELHLQNQDLESMRQDLSELREAKDRLEIEKESNLRQIGGLKAEVGELRITNEDLQRSLQEQRSD